MGTDNMSKKAWIVWACVLLLPGAVGLSIYCAQKNARLNRIEQAALADAENPAAKEYLQMYQEWSNLPAHEKANCPWGYDKYGGPDIRTRLKENQADRLLAALPELAKGLVHYPDELTEVLYGPDWPQAAEEYKKSLHTAETILISSTFLSAGGGLILAGGFIKLLVSWGIRKYSRKENTPQTLAPPTETDVAEKAAAETPSEKAEEDVEVKEDAPLETEPLKETECPSSSSIETPLTEKFETPYARKNRKRFSKSKNEGYFQTCRKQTPSDDSQASSEPNTSEPATKDTALPSLSQQAAAKKPATDSYFGWAVEMNTASPLEAMMTSEPLTRELTELTEEVSAIRQFAAQQQDQVRKLQDGYDWIIIRRFCLRVIRSIDNIADRITQMDSKQKEAAVCLKDIHDELVFALESSGIEQFEPDLNIPYKGMEKYAEAVRERIPADDENLAGCIARVIRPGYQYLVTDDNVKIVRCAQVSLYEPKQNEQE